MNDIIRLRSLAPVIALMLVYGFVLITQSRVPDGMLPITDLASLACALFAAAVVLQIAVKHISWRWIAVSCLLWAGGEAVWAYYALVLDRPVPLPSIADAFYLASIFTTLLGIIRITARKRVLAQVRTLLDGALFTFAAAAPVWHYTMRPILQAADAGSTEKLLVALYPLAYLAIVTVIGLGLLSTARSLADLSRASLFAALGCLFMTDLDFFILKGQDSYSVGSLANPIWIACFLLLACTALANRDIEAGASIETQERKWTLLQDILPALPALPVLAWLTVIAYAGRLDGDYVTPVLLICFGTSLAARQVVTIMEARFANAELALAHQEMRHLNLELQESLDMETQRARLDPLTGVLNRLGSLEQVSLMIERGTPFIVGIADFDSLKQINDLYGHAAGDYLLKRIAASLKNSSSPVVGRYGGDEFLFAIDGSDGLSVKLAQIINTIHAELQLAGKRISTGHNPTVSLGVASFPSEASTAEELIELADQRMYEDKRQRQITLSHRAIA